MVIGMVSEKGTFMEMFAHRDISVEDDIKYNYYAYDLEGGCG